MNPVAKSAVILVAPLVLATVASTGCGGGGGTAPSAAARSTREPEAALDLPPVDPHSSITVDDGRVTVSSPEGWSRAPRSKDCLVRYLPGSKGGYPSITVLASDPPAGIASVSADGHEAFVEAIATDLSGTFTHQGKSTLLRKPRSLSLGPHLAVAWMAPGRASVGGMKQEIERDCVAFVIDGRMYTVEARAPKGKLDDAGRAAARAVAANLLAVGAEPAVVPAAAGDPDAAPKPADEPAADAADNPATDAADAAKATGAD